MWYFCCLLYEMFSVVFVLLQKMSFYYYYVVRLSSKHLVGVYHSELFFGPESDLCSLYLLCYFHKARLSGLYLFFFYFKSCQFVCQRQWKWKVLRWCGLIRNLWFGKLKGEEKCLMANMLENTGVLELFAAFLGHRKAEHWRDFLHLEDFSFCVSALSTALLLCWLSEELSSTLFQGFGSIKSYLKRLEKRRTLD